LIAVEGLDGSGKSTQIVLLKRWLRSKGIKVAFTEWNSSPLVRSATKKGKKKRLLTPTTFSLLHCTDFSDRYERLIYSQLQAGYIVLSDRYTYTALARDCARGCDREWVKKMYEYAVEPHIVFFFRVPLEVSLKRILDGRSKIKYYEAGMDVGFSDDPVESFKMFQEMISNEYEQIVKEYDFEVIDGALPIEKQQEMVRKTVVKKINLKGFEYKRPGEAQ